MSNDDQDRSTWQEAKLHFFKLMDSSDTEQFDEAVRKPTAEKGTTDNWRLGLIINSIQIAVGAFLYMSFSGLVSWIGIILAVLAAIAILKWVLGL